MSARAAFWLAWSLAGLSLAMFVASGALNVLAHSAQEVPSSRVTSDALGELLFFVPFLAFPLVGALMPPGDP